MKKKPALLVSLVLLAVFIIKTGLDFEAPSKDFYKIYSSFQKTQILDRNGIPLNISYQNRWNLYDIKPLYQMPPLLKKAFVIAEDKRFYTHHGVDWLARANAVKTFVLSQNAGRGASTITEQVVKLLHPRSRNIWSKWLETLEAIELDANVNKSTILEFYLNQVPYTANRKGVVQAARYYFDRAPDSLNEKEILALAVLVRAPSKFDLYKKPDGIETPINELAKKLGITLLPEKFALAKPQLSANAQGFVEYIKHDAELGEFSLNTRMRTTLDSDMQNKTYDLLKGRLRSLKNKKVNNAAALVVDHTNGEIIAWAVVGTGCEESEYEAPGCKINMVLSPRQPGSSLKPFLYTAALDKGWTAATIIEDSPYSEAVGRGIHNFRNYSSVYYGDVTLRQALGNSLNIPALKTINYVGADIYLKKLHELGFASLTKSADFYDEGLALGNGEVTLFELVRGYATLANKGKFRHLKAVLEEVPKEGAQIYSEEAASIIGNILSDPWARLWEFGGTSSVMNLPVQTAIKTGTSSDHRDAWSVGYNDKYVVGVWMGNITREPTNGLTGSSGPVLALRGIMKELNQNRESRPLYLSPKLRAEDICISNKNGSCTARTEYFMNGTSYQIEKKEKTEAFKIIRPTNNMEMAYDPRIPVTSQYYEFKLGGLPEGQEAEYYLDGNLIYKGTSNKFAWQLIRGRHNLKADITGLGQSDALAFIVK